MNQPSPCPLCHSERVWARRAERGGDVEQIAFCPGCARDARLQLRAVPAGFTPTVPAPGLLQRVVDDVEVITVHRYARRRRLVALIIEAARRADAMARLEMELRRPSPHRAVR